MAELGRSGSSAADWGRAQADDVAGADPDGEDDGLLDGPRRGKGLVVSTGNNSSTKSRAQRAGLPWRETSELWERSIDAPSPTLTSATGAAWRIHAPGARVVATRSTP